MRGTRAARIAGLALAVLAVLAAVAAAFLNSRSFAADLEAQLARTLLERNQRSLTFEGPLEILLWPNAGFRLNRVRLSEPGSAREFAAVDNASFSVAALPLLRGTVSIQDCRLDGWRARIVRRRDGSLNIADLLPQETSPGSAFALDAAAIALQGGALSWMDEAGGRTLEASDIAVTGRGLRADTQARTFSADQLALSARVGGMQLRLDTEALASAPATLSAQRIGLTVRRDAGDAAVAASARLDADLQRKRLALDGLTGSVELTHPRLLRPLKLALKGGLHTDAGGAEGSLSSHFDESTATARLRLARYAPPALRFDIDIDRLDVARYLAPRHDEAGPTARSPSSSSASSSFDLAALDGADVNGTARIGNLKIAGIQTRNIKLEIRSEGGKLAVRGGMPAER
ncbi:MAG: AsmA family protein [Ignavibacteria bacterium]